MMNSLVDLLVVLREVWPLTVLQVHPIYSYLVVPTILLSIVFTCFICLVVGWLSHVEHRVRLFCHLAQSVETG